MSASTASKPAAKRVAKKTDEVATPAPVAAAPVATPAAPKASKAKATKAEAAPAPAPVAAPVVAAPAEAAAPAPAAEEPRLEAEVKSLVARIQSLRESLSEVLTEAKRLEKRSAKVQKLADKRRRKVKAVDGEGAAPARAVSFEMPVAISAGLCKFMGHKEGTLESRINVTRFVNKYVKEHTLATGKDHEIKPDASLRSLLGIKEGDKLTYFNLQTYLKPHYPKSKAALAAAGATA
jgi:chromatin remodeling complex protein RSC6